MKTSLAAGRLISWVTWVASVAALLLLQPANVHAEAPGLQLTPLQYVGDLTPGRIKSGYVDVANPSDSSVSIQSQVQAFRQIGTEGKLEFYNDERYQQAIKVDLTNFELGPREAVRVPFTVTPSKLPGGGIYAVIFFRTVPPAQSAASSYVAESANLGTLLELTNGPAGPHRGRIASAHFNFFQFGRGLTGKLTYENTDTTDRPVGFRPALDVRLAPWATAHRLSTGLVLPGSSREFVVSKPGSYAGVLPIRITDADTGASTTRWVLICTGWCQWALLVGLVALVPMMIFGRKLSGSVGPRFRRGWGMMGAIARAFKTRPQASPQPKRSLDGVVSRPPRPRPTEDRAIPLAEPRSMDETNSLANSTIDPPNVAAPEAVPVEFVDPILQTGESEADPRTPAFKPLPESPLPAKKRRSKAAKDPKPSKTTRSRKIEKAPKAPKRPKKS